MKTRRIGLGKGLERTDRYLKGGEARAPWAGGLKGHWIGFLQAQKSDVWLLFFFKSSDIPASLRKF